MASELVKDVREMLGEQFEYGELLYQMTKRDLLLRYKQSVMGFGWAVMMPLLNTIIFSVIFAKVAKLDVGLPYPLYAYCGLTAWNFFASSLRFGVNSLTSNTNLVGKVYFPREVFPFSAVLVSLVDFAVASSVLALMMAYYAILPTGTIVLLPVILLVHVALTCGMALLLAMGNLFFRDVKYLFEIVIQIWMFASSVLYPVSRVGGVLGDLLRLNPMTPIIDAYRDVLLYGRWPDLGAFSVAAALSFLLLGGVWIAFHRAEFKFAEYV